MKCITASLLVVTLGLSVHADPVPVTIGMPTGEDLEAMFAIAVSLYVVKILHFLLVFLDSTDYMSFYCLSNASNPSLSVPLSTRSVKCEISGHIDSLQQCMGKIYGKK